MGGKFTGYIYIKKSIRDNFYCDVAAHVLVHPNFFALLRQGNAICLSLYALLDSISQSTSLDPSSKCNNPRYANSSSPHPKAQNQTPRNSP